MSNFAFPSLDSLRQGARKADVAASTDWVGGLATEIATASGPTFGWSPPNLDLVMAPSMDILAERQMAKDEGFQKGYADGLKSGNERGVVEGRREGLELIQAEQRQLTDRFREALADTVARVDPAVERWKEAIETRATEIAMNAVRAILAAELTTSRPDALGIVREAMGHAQGALQATVRLSPFDRAALAERRDEIFAACAGLRNLELVDDFSIEGGCIVETENGVVDATLATRLDLMEAA